MQCTNLQAVFVHCTNNITISFATPVSYEAFISKKEPGSKPGSVWEEYKDRSANTEKIVAFVVPERRGGHSLLHRISATELAIPWEGIVRKA